MQDNNLISAYARKKLRKYAARKRQENTMDEEAIDNALAWHEAVEYWTEEDNDDEETEEE